MSKINNTPHVLHDPDSPGDAALYLEDGDTIQVGSSAWYNWLGQNRSFRFDGKGISYSAYNRREDYWYGGRKIEGKVYNFYLAKSAGLTLEAMLKVAAKLADVQPDSVQPSEGQTVVVHNGVQPTKARGKVVHNDVQLQELGDKLDRCQRDRADLQMQNSRLLDDQAAADRALGELRSQLTEAKADADQARKIANDNYCGYQELLQQSELWREKADERDRVFPELEQKIKSLEQENEKLRGELIVLEEAKLAAESRNEELESYAFLSEKGLELIKQLFVKVNAKMTGFKSNSFGEGVKLIKELQNNLLRFS